MIEHLGDLTQEVEVIDPNTTNNHFLIKDCKGELTQEIEINTVIAEGNSLTITSRHWVEGELMHVILIKWEQTLIADLIIIQM